MPDRTFAFPLGTAQGQAYALGTTHVGLVLPIAGVGMVSVVVEIGDAKRLSAAVEAAITTAENRLPTGLGESAVDLPPADAVVLGVPR